MYSHDCCFLLFNFNLFKIGSVFGFCWIRLICIFQNLIDLNIQTENFWIPFSTSKKKQQQQDQMSKLCSIFEGNEYIIDNLNYDATIKLLFFMNVVFFHINIWNIGMRYELSPYEMEFVCLWMYLMFGFEEEKQLR